MNPYSKNYREISHYASSNAEDGYIYVEGYGFAPPPPVVTERRLLQWYANGIGFSTLFMVFFSFTMPYLVLGVAEVLFPATRIYGNQIVASAFVIELINTASSALSLALPFILFACLCRAPFKVVLPFKRFPCSIGIPAVFIALGVSVIGLFSSTLLSAVAALFGLTPVMGAVSMPQDFEAAILFVLRLAFISPFIEELVFRGIVMNTLRRFGDSFALCVSAVLFALFHQNLVQAPNAFLMGLVIGYFTLCTGSLWVGVLIHVINNSMVLMLDGVLSLLPVEYYSIIILLVYAFYLVSGIAGLLYLVRRHPNMFMLLRSSTFSSERKKYFTFFSSATMVVSLIVLGMFLLQNIAFL